MDSLSYKTKLENKQTVVKQWFVVDAKGATLGRMSSEIAKILRGKNKPSFTPHVDCGDNVIVINAEGIVLTGNKMNEKEYITYSGYPGGQRKATARQLTEKMKRISHERNGVTLERNGLVEKAVRGMLPKTILGRAVIKNLFVYQGENHPHEAQKPTTINL